MEKRFSVIKPLLSCLSGLRNLANFGSKEQMNDPTVESLSR